MSRVINKAEAVGGYYYKARKLPAQIGIKKALRNNYQWFRRMHLQGRKLIDEGIDRGRKDRSIFYKMEQRLRKKWEWE
jgi:hypothetical protein